MTGAFFDGWTHLLRSALTAAAIYLVIVAAIRIVGENALGTYQSRGPRNTMNQIGSQEPTRKYQ